MRGGILSESSADEGSRSSHSSNSSSGSRSSSSISSIALSSVCERRSLTVMNTMGAATRPESV